MKSRSITKLPIRLYINILLDIGVWRVSDCVLEPQEILIKIHVVQMEYIGLSEIY
jgi:hypothetical protein